MRFNLTLTINKYAFGDCLPLNYQYASSAAIYRILSKSDQEFSRWLHENGFQTDDGKKKFSKPIPTIVGIGMIHVVRLK